jgi:hypothetical protein
MVSVRFSIELLQIFYNAVTKDFGRQYPCLLELKAGGFNQPGNIVIADQFNNRVIEIDPATHKIPWQFGNGSSTPGPHSIVGTNDAERVGELTLISGTGIPPVSPPLPGCPDPRKRMPGQPRTSGRSRGSDYMAVRPGGRDWRGRQPVE